jgi:hypothetical protein
MGGVYRPINVNLYRYASLNPINVSDPDGNEDVIIAPYMNKQDSNRFESKALVYENGTLDKHSTALNKLSDTKHAEGSKPFANDVKSLLGKPKSEFSNFSSLPDNPKNQGTMKAGEIYSYQLGATSKGLPGMKLSSSLGEGKVPQDISVNGGVNPAHPNRNGNMLEGAFVHGARGGDMNSPNYQTGSEGCATGYGYKWGLGDALEHSPTGHSGNFMIVR